MLKIHEVMDAQIERSTQGAVKASQPRSHLVKTVEYAYPTSTNAGRFGFSRKGCYVVEQHYWPLRDEAFKPLAGFATRAEAVAHAQAMTLPWSPMHLRFHPEDATPLTCPRCAKPTAAFGLCAECAKEERGQE